MEGFIMRKLSFILSIVLLLTLVLSVPASADTLLIMSRPGHWAQKYIDELALDHHIDPLFKDVDLNGYITVEDFQKAVRLIIDETYEGSPDSPLREAVVYEITRLWAEKTGTSLDEIMVIQMIVYDDTDKIDPKYNHAIMVAYMNNIAKGKGQGIFDPKAKTTYGELATLLYFTDKAIKDDIQAGPPSFAAGSLETRASYEVLDNKVVFDFELFSHHTSPVDLTFSSGQQFELVITDASGNEVYRYSDGKFFTMMLVNKTINPGESLKWQDEWDMTDKDGVKLTSGTYKAEITILAYETEGTEIDKDQLTRTIEFSLD